MAKKTKAQKQQSDIRRREQLVAQVQNTTIIPTAISGNVPVTIRETYKLPANNNAVVGKINSTTQYINDYSYVKSDLKRIGLFTLLAFAAEIILWYFLRAR